MDGVYDARLYVARLSSGFDFSYFFSVPGSASWRIPLGIQLIPGMVLAAGCFFLPPSPRLLVLHGKDHEARASLARLRMRTQEEAEGDLLLHVCVLSDVVYNILICHLAGTPGDACRDYPGSTRLGTRASCSTDVRAYSKADLAIRDGVASVEEVVSATVPRPNMDWSVDYGVPTCVWRLLFLAL